MKYLVIVLCLCCLIGCKIDALEVTRYVEDHYPDLSPTSVEYRNINFENRFFISFDDEISFRIKDAHFIDTLAYVVGSDIPLTNEDLDIPMASEDFPDSKLHSYFQSRLDFYDTGFIWSYINLPLNYWPNLDNTGITVNYNHSDHNQSDYTVSIQMNQYYEDRNIRFETPIKMWAAQSIPEDLKVNYLYVIIEVYWLPYQISYYLLDNQIEDQIIKDLAEPESELLYYEIIRN